MKRLVFGGILIVFSLIFINNLTSLISVPKDNSIELNKEKWQNIDGMEMKKSSSNFRFHLSWDNFITHTIYLKKRTKALEAGKSIPITDLQEEEETIKLEFIESFPEAIQQMFANHYIYLKTNSSQPIAYKIDILPYDSTFVILLFYLFIIGTSFYLLINSISFFGEIFLGVFLGILCSTILGNGDFFPITLTITTIITFLSFSIKLKLTIWSVERKVLTVPVIIVGSIIYLLIIGYICIHNLKVQEFLEQSEIYFIIVMFVASFLFFGYAIYDTVQLCRIIRLLLYGQKIPIIDFVITSAHIETPPRGSKGGPSYYTTVEINNKVRFIHLHCTRAFCMNYKNNIKFKVKTLYLNEKGDMVIL